MSPELLLALALTAADASQTEWIAQHPLHHCEDNFLMGKHPSQAKVAGYFAASAGALLAGNALLKPADAKVLNYVWVGVEAGAVSRNLAIGVRFSL
jgi:hypothetical protein